MYLQDVTLPKPRQIFYHLFGAQGDGQTPAANKKSTQISLVQLSCGGVAKFLTAILGFSGYSGSLRVSLSDPNPNPKGSP